MHSCIHVLLYTIDQRISVIYSGKQGLFLSVALCSKIALGLGVLCGFVLFLFLFCFLMMAFEFLTSKSSFTPNFQYPFFMMLQFSRTNCWLSSSSAHCKFSLEAALFLHVQCLRASTLLHPRTLILTCNGCQPSETFLFLPYCRSQGTRWLQH